jgi:O-antigen/teichoic acid export membrane protein
MRANFDVKNFALLEIFRSIVYFVAVYLFVDKFQNGFDGAIDSNLISYVFSMILILYINIKKIKLYFSFTLLLKLLSFGVPFILSSLILWASTQSDRYFLMYFKDDYILGVYGFSLSIASIFILIKTSIKNAIDPYIMKLHHYREKKLKRIISELYTVSLFLFSFMFLIASFFMKDITLLIGGDKFTDSIIYTPYVILIVLITTVNQYFIYGINFNHRNGLVLKCLIYSLIINLILSVILINIWGVAGIILANVVSGIIYSYLLYRESNKLYPIEYLKLDNLRIVFSALIVFGINIIYLSNNEHVSHIVIILMFLLINQRVYFNFKSIYALN